MGKRSSLAGASASSPPRLVDLPAIPLANYRRVRLVTSRQLSDGRTLLEFEPEPTVYRLSVETSKAIGGKVTIGEIVDILVAPDGRTALVRRADPAHSSTEPGPR